MTFRDVWGNRFSRLQLGKSDVLYMFGCTSPRRIEWCLNHVHSTKYAEVMHAFCAANSDEIDYSCEDTSIGSMIGYTEGGRICMHGLRNHHMTVGS